MSMGTATAATTATGVEIIPANGARRGFGVKSLLTNTQTAFLKFDPSDTALTAANGWPVEPGGEIIITRETFVAGDTGIHQVKAITSSGTADLRWFEL